jgi:hypothetical protein
METIRLTLNDLIQMTQYVGEDWAVAHARRLFELIKQMGWTSPTILRYWDWRLTCMIGEHFHVMLRSAWNILYGPMAG